MSAGLDAARVAMVNELVRRHPSLDPAVVAVMREVPRHEFAPTEAERFAYDQTSVGIGEGQVMSSPEACAVCLDALDLQPGDSVLEIGTGSGYLAACLSLLCARVETWEARPKLASQAATNLARFGAKNVIRGIGRYLPDFGASYDKVVYSCATRQPLAVGQSRLVLPLAVRSPILGAALADIEVWIRDGLFSRREKLGRCRTCADVALLDAAV